MDNLELKYRNLLTSYACVKDSYKILVDFIKSKMVIDNLESIHNVIFQENLSKECKEILKIVGEV